LHRCQGKLTKVLRKYVTRQKMQKINILANQFSLPAATFSPKQSLFYSPNERIYTFRLHHSDCRALLNYAGFLLQLNDLASQKMISLTSL